MMEKKDNSSDLIKFVHLEILAKLIITPLDLYFRANHNGNRLGLHLHTMRLIALYISAVTDPAYSVFLGDIVSYVNSKIKECD